MQQRRVRLGDILDDYCPRERRITNHAVVAMIEDEVKQTRCTTCDADHEYKQAKVPAPRRKKPERSPSPSTCAARVARPPVPIAEAPVVDEELIDETVEDHSTSRRRHRRRRGAGRRSPTPSRAVERRADEPSPTGDRQDEWPVHRPLIRATLPRPEGQTPERKAPDFTIRQNGGRFDGQRNGNTVAATGRPRQAQGQSSGPAAIRRLTPGSGHGPASRRRAAARQSAASGQPSGAGRSAWRTSGPGGGSGRGSGRGPKRGR